VVARMPFVFKRGSIKKAAVNYSKEGFLVKPDMATWLLTQSQDSFSVSHNSILLEPNEQDYTKFKKMLTDMSSKNFANETDVKGTIIVHFYSFIKRVSWYVLGTRWDMLHNIQHITGKNPFICINCNKKLANDNNTKSAKHILLNII
jgi:hypothetical protein